MPTVSETALAAMPVGVPTSFGNIVPSFERLLGYVDASAAPPGSRIKWKLYATSGGVRALAAVSDPIPSSANPYLIFAEPDEGIGRGVGMIAGTTYEIVGEALDGSLVNIRAGFVGYDIEANTQPNEVAAVTQPLVFGAEVVFGTLAQHHARVQVQFDQGATVNTSGEVRVYGTITGLAGPITVLLARGVLTDAESDPSIPLDLQGLGFVTATLRIIALNPGVGAGNVTGVIIGADLNLDIGGGGVVLLANSSFASGIIYRPGGPAWSPATPTVFPVWGGGFPSVMAAIGLTQGNVDVEIDDSIVSPAPIPSAGMPVGGWDMEGRVSFTKANPNVASSLVNIPDGATLLNLKGWEDVNIIGNSLLAGSNLPALSYTRTLTVKVAENAQFIGFTGTRPMVDIGAGTSISLICDQGVLFQTGAAGAEIFDLLTVTSILAIFFVAGVSVAPAQNLVAGVLGSNLFFQRDETSGSFVLNGARMLGGSAFFLVQGPEQKQTVIIGAVTLVIDALAINTGQAWNEVIFCKPTGAGTTIIDLPDATLPMNKGRIITIVDDNGTSNANTISLVPFGAQLLNGANALKALSSSWGAWTARCDGAQWVVSQQAGI